MAELEGPGGRDDVCHEAVKKPVDEKRNAGHNLVSVLQMQRRESGRVLRVRMLRCIANVL